LRDNRKSKAVAAKQLKQAKEINKQYFNSKVALIMSLGATRKDFWESTARSTVSERFKSIFNQELMSDVKFVVRDSQGESESKVPAHKFVLAISSPVFFAMFYGDLAETKDFVEVTDCEYESLFEMLRFIYSDEANLNPDNVMQVMYLAKKYMLPALADKCSAFLQKNLDGANVFSILPDAQKYEEEDLLDHCWKVIEKETEEAVKSDGFLTIEKSVLEELVEKDSLSIKEVELFQALDCWAVKECEKQGVVAEGSVKRRILGERIVKGIRFPVMKQEEFADIVLDSDILTQKEAYRLMKHFSSVLKPSLGFSETERAGQVRNISRFRCLTKGWSYYSGGYNDIGVIVDKDIKLHAVRFFGSESNEYSVNLTVKHANGVVVATERGNFVSKDMQSEIGKYRGFDVEFKSSVALEQNICYSFDADITGPPSWYGESGLSSVKHSGVNFVFKSVTSRSPLYCDTTYDSSVVKGQFPEFLFSLG